MNIESDNFLRTLWEIFSEQSATIKTQQSRLHQLWNDAWLKLQINLPPIRPLELDKNRFFSDIPYRLDRVKTLHAAMNDTYFVIKTIVDGIFNQYIQSDLITDDFPEEDLVPVSFLISEIIVGSLLQYIVLDKAPIPIGFLVIAKNKSLMKIKPLSCSRITSDLEKNGFQVSKEEIQTVLNEMEALGYLKSEIDVKSNENAYRFIKEFNLTPEGEVKFNKQIKPILEWTVGIWRSLYNIRSIDTPIPKDYPYLDFLTETVKRAATQGFLTASNVMENIANYYQLILDNGLTVP